MHADHKPRRHKPGDTPCDAMNRRGARCGNAADDHIGSQFCLLHDPDRLVERSAYQKAMSEMAQAARRRPPSLSALAADVPPTRLDTFARIRKMLERVAGEVESSDEPPVQKATALSRIASEVRGLLEAGDQENRLAEVERLLAEQERERGAR